EAMAERTRGEEVQDAGDPRDEVPPAAFERPTPISQMAAIDLAVGGAKLLVASSVLSGHIAVPVDAAVRQGLGGTLLPAAALGLWTLRPFGRYAQFAMAALTLYSGILAFAVAIPIVIYLARPGVALLLSGRDPATLSPAQRRRVREDTASPRMIPVAVGLYALLATISLWGSLAAIVSR